MDADVSSMRGGSVEIGLIKHDGRLPGTLGFGPDLHAEGVAEAPLDQAGHGPGVGLASEQPGVPLFCTVEIGDGAVGVHTADHGGVLPG
ncbi:hypothetical protein [Nocardioides psychrotolerans]|uniref:hypothetical protein n=1 Tax=Nocardioides psychrotolerans TaxID=1005945 RepID=UPI0014787FAB|nr:hypothetical protein [Nocardioides psychrotolerans]